MNREALFELLASLPDQDTAAIVFYLYGYLRQAEAEAVEVKPGELLDVIESRATRSISKKEAA